MTSAFSWQNSISLCPAYFILKENNQVQHMTTFFNKLWKDICFLRIGKFAHRLDIKCSFYWEQKSIFFISYHSTKNTHYIYFVKCSSFPKILQEKWIRCKRENEMMVYLELKRDTSYTMRSCYGWIVSIPDSQCDGIRN